MPKYECHITCSRIDSNKVLKIAEETKWKFSAIDGDPIMGKEPYCYLTQYCSDPKDLYDSMKLVCRLLTSYDVKVLREKIEQIIYDTKTGVDELGGGNQI